MEEKKAKKAPKKNNWKNNEHKAVLIVFCVIFSFYAISLIYPLIYIFVKSFQETSEFQFVDTFFPKKITFENYTEMAKAFKVGKTNFIGMTFNTILLGLLTPTAQLTCCCCFSYAYSKFDFKLKPLIFIIAIASMFIPSVGTLPITYKLMADLNLKEKLIGYVIMCSGGLGFSFLLVSGQYDSVSNEYSEAAQIDGASRFRTFAQIVTPQILPTVTALWVLSFISSWNDYAGPFLFLKKHPTLSVGIYQLQLNAAKTGGATYPVLFAGIILVAMPVIIIFFVFQKKILEISLGGGIKG